MIVPNISQLGAVGSDAAILIPSNRVAVALPMDRLTSVAYAVQPGDHVDVIVSFLFVDVDREFQSRTPNGFLPYSPVPQLVEGLTTPIIKYEPAGGIPIVGEFDTRQLPDAFGTTLVGLNVPQEFQRPRLASQRTVTDALVVFTGDFPLDGKLFPPPPPPTPTNVPGTEIPTPETSEGVEPGTAAPLPTATVQLRPDIVTLAVAPQDAVVLTWLVEAHIPVTFALRSATVGTSLVPTDMVSLDYIMQRFSITVPEKFDFSIEPAIRSIRQLSVGSTIALNPPTLVPTAVSTTAPESGG
jgi:pilus assembly protein CpaB